MSEGSCTTTAERQPVVGYHTLSKQSSCVGKHTHQPAVLYMASALRKSFSSLV